MSPIYKKKLLNTKAATHQWWERGSQALLWCVLCQMNVCVCVLCVYIYRLVCLIIGLVTFFWVMKFVRASYQIFLTLKPITRILFHTYFIWMPRCQSKHVCIVHTCVCVCVCVYTIFDVLSAHALISTHPTSDWIAGFLECYMVHFSQALFHA